MVGCYWVSVEPLHVGCCCTPVVRWLLAIDLIVVGSDGTPVLVGIPLVLVGGSCFERQVGGCHCVCFVEPSASFEGCVVLLVGLVAILQENTPNNMDCISSCAT